MRSPGVRVRKVVQAGNDVVAPGVGFDVRTSASSVPVRSVCMSQLYSS